jgi:hypothetical protein
MWLDDLYPSVADGVRLGRIPLVARLAEEREVQLCVDAGGRVRVGGREFEDLQTAVDALSSPRVMDAWDVVFVQYPDLPPVALRSHQLAPRQSTLSELLKKHWGVLPEETRALATAFCRRTNARGATEALVVSSGACLTQWERSNGRLAADISAYQQSI